MGRNRGCEYAAVLIPFLTVWVKLRTDFAIQRVLCAEHVSAHGLISRNNQ